MVMRQRKKEKQNNDITEVSMEISQLLVLCPRAR